jgi:hypothetical protein
MSEEAQEKPMSVEEGIEEVKAKSVYESDTDEESPEETETQETTEETPDEESDTDEEETEEEQESEEEPEEETEEKKFKYKSLEEAEKGIKEAERKMHEATAEAKALRDEIEELKRETEQAADEGKITESEERTLKNVFVDMLSKIDDLDVSDDAYREQLADVWAKGLSEGWSLQEEKRNKVIQAQQAEEDENRRVFNLANKMAQGAGLDMEIVSDSSGNQVSTIDYDLFWNTIAKSEPVGNSIEDRINWAIDQVKTRRNKDFEAYEKKQESLKKKSKEAQNKNKVLEKGVKKPTEDKVEDEKPLSITEALQRTERRI